MSLLALRLRSDVRAQWRAWLLLSVVTGLVAGATIAVLAGARRTETAYQRFLQKTRAFDLLVTNGGTTADNVNRQFDFSQLAHRPEVAASARLLYRFRAGRTAAGRELSPSDVTPVAPVDGRFGASVNEARVLQGRLPKAEAEVAVTFLAAERLGIHLGELLRLEMGPARGPPDGPVAFRVVGVVAMAGGFPPITGGLPPLALLSTAYASAHPDGAEILAVRLKGGRSAIAPFERELDRLAGNEQVVTTDEIELTTAVQRGLDVQATALRLLGAMVAAFAALLVGQALARQSAAEAAGHPTLRALGTTDAQLRTLGFARSVGSAAVTALVATVTAVALSGLTPVGVARRAEVHAGVAVNTTYVGLGALAVFAAVAGMGGLAAAWSARSVVAARSARPVPVSQLGNALARAGFPVPTVVGARMALERGRGTTAAPVRSTMLGVVLGLAAVTCVLGFSTSLRHLFDDPRLYGWNWDIQVGDAFSPDLTDTARRVAGDPAAAAVSVGTEARIQIGDVRIDTLAIENRSGHIEPAVVEGRAPAAADEILLGTRSLAQVGVRLGDSVTVTAGDHRARMRVVGRGILTEFAGAARLGEGAAVTMAGLRLVLPDAITDVVLVRVSPGAAGTSLLRRLTTERPGNVYLPEKPSDLTDLERVGGIPSVVAGLLGVLAVVTMGHALVTSVRRRRRDLAVLKALGLVRSQVAAVVAWQSSLVGMAGVVAGIPIGVAGGRMAWQLFADRLGVPPRALTPLLTVALLVPATVALANLVAALPARLAASTPPGTVLRAE